jgi:hypothetical protein
MTAVTTDSTKRKADEITATSKIPKTSQASSSDATWHKKFRPEKDAIVFRSKDGQKLSVEKRFLARHRSVKSCRLSEVLRPHKLDVADIQYYVREDVLLAATGQLDRRG